MLTMFRLCIGTRYLLLMDIDTGAKSPNGKIGSWLAKNAIVLRFFSQLRSIASMNNCSFIEPISSIRTHVIITNFFRLNSNSCSLDFFQFKVWKFTFTMQFRFYGEWKLLFVPIEPEKKQSSKKTQNWFHNSIKLNWKKNSENLRATNDMQMKCFDEYTDAKRFRFFNWLLFRLFGSPKIFAIFYSEQKNCFLFRFFFVQI